MITTALLVIIPVIATVLFGAIARATILREIPKRESVTPVRSVVVEKRSPVEREALRRRQVNRAA